MTDKPIYNHVRQIPGGILFLNTKTNEGIIKYFANEPYEDISDFMMDNIKRWLRTREAPLDIDNVLENLWVDKEELL